MINMQTAFGPYVTVTYAAAAALCDVKTGKIGNPLIILGWTAGLCLQTVWQLPSAREPAEVLLRGSMQWLSGALIPLLPGILLHRLGMIGAGDGKLLSALGSCVGPEGSVRIMLASVFCGAMVSLPLLVSVTGVRERRLYFASYVREVLETGRIPSYRKASGSRLRPEEFHFAVAVFMAVLLYMGGYLPQL